MGFALAGAATGAAQSLQDLLAIAYKQSLDKQAQANKDKADAESTRRFNIEDADRKHQIAQGDENQQFNRASEMLKLQEGRPAADLGVGQPTTGALSPAEQADPHFMRIPQTAPKPVDFGGGFQVRPRTAEEMSAQAGAAADAAERRKVHEVGAGGALVQDGQEMYRNQKDEPQGSVEDQYLSSLARERGVPVGQLSAKDRLDAHAKFADSGRKPEGETFVPDAQQVDQYARAVLDRRMSPSQLNQQVGGFGGNGQIVKRAVGSRIMQLNPNVNFEELESNYKFGASSNTQNTVRMLDQIQNTIPVLHGLVDKMKLANVRIVNKAEMAASRQFGEGDVASFDLARNIIADEFAKILQGGGSGSGTSDAKMKQALDLMGGDMSPAQWEGVLNTANELLSSRRGSLTKGTFMDKGGQAPESAGKFSVTDPTGKVHPFETQAQADAFKKLAGIK